METPTRGGGRATGEAQAQGLGSGVRRRSFRAADGVRLAWYEVGPATGPPLLLAGGLGGGFEVWRPLVSRFSARYRVISWDYRGLYGSDALPQPAEGGVPQHVEDLLALLRHAQVEHPLLVGWSMGVQVGLELHRENPKLLHGFVGLHGAAGRVFESAFDSAWTARLAPGALALLRGVGTGLRGVGPWLVRAPGVAVGFVRAARGLGLMAPSLDADHFRDIAAAWTTLDFTAYAGHFATLAAHDASDLLPTIETPTLLIAGGRDRLTPARRMVEMAEAMPDAELALLPDATHFGLLEEPDAIVQGIARFASERLGLPLP